jgi:uncharacterized protein with NRDE domain
MELLLEAQRLKCERMQGTLQKHDLEKGELDWQELFSDVMGDRRVVEDQAALPQTGLGIEMDTRLSAIFVEPWEHNSRLYGTRSQTGIAVWKDGHVEVRERNIKSTGLPDGDEVEINFFLSSPEDPEGDSAQL